MMPLAMYLKSLKRKFKALIDHSLGVMTGLPGIALTISVKCDTTVTDDACHSELKRMLF
jgi:hypothetical protein